jgi:histidine triad (HIT) family protein
MSDCLFCKIVSKEIPSEIVLETNNIIAFNDINPQAPVHILIIPRKHISTINDLENSDSALISEMFLVAKELASEKGIAIDGYRTVFNCNSAGGQEVYHIHLHLLGGRQMNWPPG